MTTMCHAVDHASVRVVTKTARIRTPSWSTHCTLQDITDVSASAFSLPLSLVMGVLSTDACHLQTLALVMFLALRELS